MSELIATTTPKARKAHRCWACGATIHPRERYRREARASDGSAYALKLCLPCDDATPHVATWSSNYDIGPETYAEWAEDAAAHTGGIEQQQAIEYLRRAKP